MRCEWLYRLVPFLTGGAEVICHIVIGFLIGTISFVIFPGSIYMILPFLFFGLGKELINKYIRKLDFKFFNFFGVVLGGVLGIFIIAAIEGVLK